jgi:hypothetical protein
MLDALNRALDEYTEKYRRPGLARLETSGLYALFPGEENQGVTVVSGWPKEYPNSSRKGGYAIFGRTGKLLYIGKASMNHYIGSRLGNYFRQKKLTKACVPIHNGWSERPSCISTIAVPDEMSFEAPALEEYLIQRLNPSHNVMGLSRSE